MPLLGYIKNNKKVTNSYYLDIIGTPITYQDFMQLTPAQQENGNWYVTGMSPMVNAYSIMYKNGLSVGQALDNAGDNETVKYDETDDGIYLMRNGVWEFWKTAGLAYPIGTVTEFEFTGTIQSFVIPATGHWQLEVWGAQGGYGQDDWSGGPTYPEGGKGGYAKGIVSLESDDTIYVVVGGRGKNAGETQTTDHSYNGGGSYGGGGATHIGLTQNVLKDTLASDLLIVGGGGGGGGFAGAWQSRVQAGGGTGGGLQGGNGGAVAGDYPASGGIGGSQSAGGSGKANGTYGKGGDGYSSSGAGGGGGYYGGGSGYMASGYAGDWGSGGGGSSFFATSLSDTQTLAGQRSGNGYATLTFLG